MDAEADAIADCVLSTFNALPEKRKPRRRNAGEREWVPLSGIVLTQDGNLTCVSLGTGMKCLPSSKLSLARGNVLHDWHAEVVAIRAFNRFLLDEIRLLSTPPYPASPFVRRREQHELTEAEFQPFCVRDNVGIHMYCSEAPCGDASMELVMDAQEDATPWTSPLPTISTIPNPTAEPHLFDRQTSNETGGSIEGSPDLSMAALRGRSHFGHLGAVRLKPSRPDAPPTLSKSCTDKLALAQCTSLLSSSTSLLISPRNAYISVLILPKTQYVESAASRAFSRNGRMSGVTEEVEKQWLGSGAGYAFKPFHVRPTSREFDFSRRSVQAHQKAMPSNVSALYTPHLQETLIGGVLQGRKQFDPKGASAICRRSMWRAIGEIAALVSVPRLLEAARGSSYADVKRADVLEARRKVKADVKSAALKGWVENRGDDDFSLDHAGSI